MLVPYRPLARLAAEFLEPLSSELRVVPTDSTLVGVFRIHQQEARHNVVVLPRVCSRGTAGIQHPLPFVLEVFKFVSVPGHKYIDVQLPPLDGQRLLVAPRNDLHQQRESKPAARGRASARRHTSGQNACSQQPRT